MSAAAKFTPGPWLAEVVGVSSVGPDGVDVYEVTNGHARIAEHVAEPNAHLIAAAPDLYEALREFIRLTQDHIGSVPTEFIAAMEEGGRAALAKAEGRS